jgi:hypothetical protein
MFVWIDKGSGRSVGFGISESTRSDVANHKIDAEVYSALLSDPNKLRWGRLTRTESGQEFRIILPPAVKKFRCARIPIEFSEVRPISTENLSLWLDLADNLHVECLEHLPDLYLTVCPKSVFLPMFCRIISMGVQPMTGLRSILLEKPSSQVFLSNVWSHWTSTLTVQINKGQ